MRSWTSREAQESLDALLDSVRRKGPQRVQRDEDGSFVVLDEELFRKLLEHAPDLGSLIASSPLDSEALPARIPARAYSDDHWD